jgi:SAM-dependent methyltransferase
MGISRGAVTLLGMTLRQARRSGSVITFGVQKVEATHDEALVRLSKAGIDPAPVPRSGDGRIPQDALFRMLGYDSAESLDYFAAEAPTHVHDLNRPIPASLQRRFDLVYDGGTTEHCFSVAECLSNVVRLLRNGGRVIHHLPLNNWVDHGFYQFSPGLFFDFYEANGFDELRMSLHFMTGRSESFISYDPCTDGSLPYQLGGRARSLAFFSARKAHASDAIVFPIQGRYRRAFGEVKERSAPLQKLSGLSRLRRSILKRTLRLRAKQC